jgi:hypothetical protein
MEDGLQGFEFNLNSYYKTQNGEDLLTTAVLAHHPCFPEP